MKKIFSGLVAVTLLLSILLAGCGGDKPAVNNPVIPAQNNSSGTPSTTPAPTDVVPINILAEQLMANPNAYIGKTVSFSTLVTGFGPGYILLDKIKATADEIPAGTAVENTAEVIGLCEGVVDGLVIITGSTIIPACDS